MALDTFAMKLALSVISNETSQKKHLDALVAAYIEFDVDLVMLGVMLY